jgi:hypothetical protein
MPELKFRSLSSAGKMHALPGLTDLKIGHYINSVLTIWGVKPIGRLYSKQYIRPCKVKT